IHLPPRWTDEAECRRHDVGRLQEGGPAPRLARPPRDGGRQAGAGVLLGCVRQADGLGYVDERAIGGRLALATCVELRAAFRSLRGGVLVSRGNSAARGKARAASTVPTCGHAERPVTTPR